MKKEVKLYDMTKGALLPKMLGFTLPFVLANLLQTVYTITDLAIIGQFAGSIALGAVSISSQVTMLLTLVGSGLANGGQIYVAQLVGQNRKDDIRRTTGTLLTSVLFCALAVAVLTAALSAPALRWMNVPEEAFIPARDYLLICCPGLFALFGYNAVCAVLRGMGESKAPTVFIAVSAAVNVVGDLILVAGLDMGAAGAALATTVSQIAAFVVSFLYLYRQREALELDFGPGSFRIDGDKVKVIFKLALPLVLMQSFINVSMLYVNSYINTFGLAAASLSGIGGKLYGVVTMVSSAFSAAMSTVVGQNIGARRFDRIKQALVISTAIDLVIFAFVAFVVLVFPRAVFGVFTTDETVLQMAPQYLRIALWAYLFFALMHPALGTLNGVGNTTLSCVIGILDGVVARIGLSLLLGTQFGMWGYFTGYCLAGGVSVIMGWAYIFSGRWKTRELLN